MPSSLADDGITMSDQSSNPFSRAFGPKGLVQAQARADEQAGGESPFQAAFSGEGTDRNNPFAPRNWYTGGNTQGQENGYDTPFYQKMFEQQDRNAKNGTLATWYKQPDATGIQTWDTDDTEFGDVWQDGKKVGNVYRAYDKETADLLMADFTLDDDTKARAFKNGGSAISDEVQRARQKQTVESRKFLSQQAYRSDVEETEEGFRDSGGEAVTVAGGAAGGAAVAAGVAGVAALTGVGAVAAPFIIAGGAAIGGISAWLNQDELLDMAARAKVQQDMANEEFGKAAGFSAGLQGWSGLGTKAISPFSNLTHGIYDASQPGGVGDSEQAFYKVDDLGKTVRPWWVTGVDMGASVADSLLQFASPIGKVAYIGSTSGNIAGQVGTLGFTGGRTFDDRSGTYDSIFTDDQGNTDVGAAAAGIGSIAIDAVQLGMAKGLAGKAGQSQAALRGGPGKVTEAGFRYTLNEEGVATGRRVAASFLAPSEMIQNVSATWLARSAARARGANVIDANDIYEQVGKLATGERRLAAALVNGFGEGSEEGIQALLEPISHGSQANWQDVVHSALMGGATGVGMTLGSRVGAATAQDRIFAKAKVNYFQQTGQVLERSTFDGWEVTQQRNAAVLAPGAVVQAKQAAAKLANDLKTDAVASLPMVDKLNDALAAKQAVEAGSLNVRLDGAYRITAASSSEQRNDAVTASISQVLNLAEIKEEGAKAQLAAAAATPLEDGGQQQLRIELLTAVAGEAELIRRQLEDAAGAYSMAGSLAEGRMIIEAMNRELAAAFDNEAGDARGYARARAASHLFVRDPQDQAGSYQLLVPQISAELSRMNANNGLQVSLATLQAIGGDFDGDKIRSQSLMELDDNGFRNIRAGLNLIGAPSMGVNIATRKYEEYELTEMSRALDLPPGSALHSGAAAAIEGIRSDINARYGAQIPQFALDDVFAVFTNAVHMGNTKARQLLLDAFSNQFGSLLAEKGQRELSNEWFALDQIVQHHLQEFQAIYAGNTPRVGTPDTNPVQDIYLTPEVKAFRKQGAATTGMTMAQKVEGWSIFRMFQKLHYSKYLAPVVQDNQRVEDIDLQELIEYYRQINDGETKSALDQLGARDDVTGRVLFQLETIASQAKLDTGNRLNSHLAVSQLAFARVPDLSWDADGNVTVESTNLTLLQVLLKQSIRRDKQEKAAVATEEQESRWAALERLTRPGSADRAFVDVFGNVPLYDLLGTAADSMGRNRTVEQFVRILNSQNERERSKSKQRLHAAPEYQGNERTNPPYDFTEDGRSMVTSYQAVVDAMFGTSNKRLSHGKDGLSTGDLGDSGPATGSEHGIEGLSYRTQEALLAGLRDVQSTFREFTGWRRLDRKTDADIAQVMLENPAWAKGVLDLIPNAAANVVFEQVTDARGNVQTYVARWVYEMIRMENVDQAAMHYWRNLTESTWIAKSAEAAVEHEDPRVAYDKLTNRFHQLIFRLREQDPMGVRLNEFLADMADATDVREFMRLVNNKYRADEAPYVAWVADVSEFDPDKAGGGLTKEMESAELRKAVGIFQSRSSQLVKTISQEQQTQQADEALRAQLLLDDVAAANGAPTTAILTQLDQAIAFSQSMTLALDPAARAHEGVMAQRGFYGNASDKGKSPEHVTPYGELAAKEGGPGRKTADELAIGALTAVDADDFGQDMHAGLVGSFDATDEQGRPISWKQLTRRGLIDLMQQPGSMPAVRAILYPTVQARTENGSLVSQFMTKGRSLKALLEGKDYTDYVTSVLASDKKLYASMIDSLATAKGEANAFTHQVNDILIARTSASRTELSTEAMVRNQETAEFEMVDILRTVGELAREGAGTPAGADNLARALNEARQIVESQLGTHSLARLFNLTIEEQAAGFGDVLLDDLIARAESERDADIRDALVAGDLATEADVRRATEADAVFEEKRQALEALRSDNTFANLVTMYRIPKDEKTAAIVKQSLVAYVQRNLTMLEHTGWAQAALQDLTIALLRDPNELPRGIDWDTISRAVIADSASRISGPTAGRLSTPELASLDKAELARYWDSSYMYLAEKVLDPTSAMVQAARDMQVSSGLTQRTATPQKLANQILSKLLDPQRLGQWTPDIPQQSVSNKQRLDSAGVEPAITGSGNSPKNQATESAATRRTVALPPEELVSTLVLPGDALAGNQATVTIPTSINTSNGPVDTELHLVQLNGRFARSVTMTYRGQPVNQSYVDVSGALADEPNMLRWVGPEVGITYPGLDEVRDSGYQAITVNRLRTAIERVLPLQPGEAVQWDQVEVQMEYLHPESQPALSDFANNIFFEGIIYEDAGGDTGYSLNASKWFQPGGLNPNYQAMALQANKKGRLALILKDLRGQVDPRTLEAGWETDLARVLRNKARVLTVNDLGGGAHPPSLFNAQYKTMKMRHWVRGFVEGQPVLLSAEQVIALQQAGAAMPDRAELYKPSDRTLRTMLGEIGPQGQPGVNDFSEIDTSMIPTYRGDTAPIIARVPRILELDENGEFTRGDLLKTRAVGRANASQLTSKPAVTDRERTALEKGQVFLAQRASTIQTARQTFDRTRTELTKNTQVAKDFAESALKAVVNNVDLPSMGIPVGSVRSAADTLAARRLVATLSKEILLNDWSAGWILRHGGTAGLAAGEYSSVDLAGDGKVVDRNTLAMGDLVAVDLASYYEGGIGHDEAMKKASKDISRLSQRKVNIVLPDGYTGGNMRAELGFYLEELGYERLNGSPHVFVPRTEIVPLSANRAGRLTSLVEKSGTTAESVVAVGLFNDLDGLEENALGLNPKAATRQVAVGVDLLLTSYLGKYNLPRGEYQVEQTKAMVRGLLENDLPHLFKLQKVAEGSVEALELTASLRKLVGNWDADPENPSILPRTGSWGVGDIVPLFAPDATGDSAGSLVLLRHGYVPPKAAAVREQQNTPRIEGTDLGMNVAIASTERMPGHTVHVGDIRRFLSRGSNGLAVELSMELQQYFDKTVLEGSGMKYLVTPMDGNRFAFPEHDMFEGWPLDGVASMHDTLSKESVGGIVNNFRTAFNVLGIDFMPDLVKFFTGTDIATLAVDDPQRVSLVTATREFLQLASERLPRRSIADVERDLRNSSPDTILADMQASMAAGSTTAFRAAWANEISAATRPPEADIAYAVLSYLQLPGAEVDDVLQAGGFSNASNRASGLQSVLMPPIFTDYFGRSGLTSPLREHLMAKLNRQFNNPPGSREGYHLMPDFSFVVTTVKGEKISQRVGRLQFAEMRSTGDNPLLDGMAYDRGGNQGVSYHSDAVAQQAHGGRTAASKLLKKTRGFASRVGVPTMDTGEDLLRALSAVKPETMPKIQHRSPAEQEYRDQAYDEVGAYRVELSTEGWEEVDKNAVAKFQAATVDAAQSFGLDSSQATLVHGWIRQLLGRPVDATATTQVTYLEAMDALREIKENATNGYLPIYGGEVQRLSYADLNLIFNANKGDSPRFRLRSGPMATTFEKRWSEWVHVGLGYGRGDQLFDPVYLLALDGFTHTYLDAGSEYLDLPVSESMLRNQKLLTANGEQVLSMDPNRQMTLSETPLFSNQEASLTDFSVGQRYEGRVRGQRAPASELGKRRAQRKAWRKENGIPEPVEVASKNFRDVGAEYVERASNESALLRFITDLRVANALLNPALFVSAFAETGLRGALEDISNTLVGTSLSAGGQVTSRLAQWAQDHTPESWQQLQETFGFDPVFSPMQVKQFRRTSEVLASRTDFRSMIYRELMFTQPLPKSAGRIAALAHGAARLGAKSQDPTYGLTATTLARRYVESVMASLAADPLGTTATPDYIAAQLALNPTWVQTHLPTAHDHAVATIANVRSIKATPISLGLRGIYEPLSQNPNALVAYPSTLFLKLPLMFSGYALNVATTMLGLQGWSNLVAMQLDGKRNRFSRLQARMAGREYNPASDGLYDMSSVIEGVDLTKSFVQSGVSLTSLFVFGSIAGGLGLSGEDEEDKRRRRAAELQGAGYVYDPRKIENDFRNADAIYLDNLPFGLSALAGLLGGPPADSDPSTRQIAMPHWIVKQFVSPIMGMSRYFETGDIRQIGWGFSEAIGSFPLINQAMWSDASQVFAELNAQADTQELEGSDSARNKALELRTSAIMTYERMLFENSFVNMIYVGMDQWDRDPYALPLMDSDGDMQRDSITGAPRPTDALQPFVNEQGELQQGYVSAQGAQAKAAGFAENRLGVALITSLFDGRPGLTSSLRQNMVVKTRTVEKPELDQGQAESLVMSLWDDEQQTELLTNAGGTAIFTGLFKGTVKFGDPALEGVFIPMEMRKEIQAKWMENLVQEGLDIGLSESKAKARMKELWYGSLTNPDTVGIGDILFDKRIPYVQDTRYYQLNTTYVTGPDGMPWATGVTRDKWMGALGLQPLARFYGGVNADDGNLPVDRRLNSTDPSANINTGLRALVRADDSWLVPTDEEIGEAIEKAIEEAAAKVAGSTNSGNGYTPFGRYGRGGGYGGGGGGGYGARLSAPQDNQTPYGNSVPFINTGNPIIRRATIRRERFDTDRGRLNQWQ